jgi:hypothetical protein
MMHVRRIPLGIAVLGLLFTVVRVQATTVIQPTFEKLVGSSDYIVRAVVKSVDSEWRENPAKPGQRYIGSKVTLDVREVIKGTPPNPLVLDLVGGRVGQEELTIDGAPKFQAGDEDILFVSGNGTNFFPLTGMMHGYFPIRHDARTGRDQMLRYDGRLLYNAGELEPTTANFAPIRSAQDRPMTPESFRDRIQQQQNDITSREKLR